MESRMQEQKYIEIRTEEQLTERIENNPVVEKVVFHTMLTKVPQKMFYNCDNLESVVFHKSVLSIGEAAFFGCEKLREVRFESEVYGIEDEAFADTPLLEVEFHNDVSIKGKAFYDCGNYGEMLHFAVEKSLETPELDAFAKKAHINIVRISDYGTEKIATSKYPLMISTKKFGVKIGSKQILSDVDIKIGPGEMIMVIGGSGTGKSTLIKNLFGLEDTKSKVTVQVKEKQATGYPTSTAVQKLLKNKVFYAPQFGISNERLTVEQEIQKNALMFQGKRYTDTELKELTKKFFLWDKDKKILSTKVGKISGGQKKKLMMACSQAGESQILVFDEPDSGLDEPSAFNMFIQDLRKDEVCGKGKTVIVVSHHPHNFMNDYRNGNQRIEFDKIFTRLIVLAKVSNEKGGTIAFSGTPLEAKAFFNLGNDPYSRIVSYVMTEEEGGEKGNTREKIQKYIDKYRKSREEN